MQVVSSRLLRVSLCLALGAASLAASAYEGDLKRGRLYFRQICTACHQTMLGKAIAPNERTKADWSAYVKADKHDKSGKSNPSMKYFTTKAYRETIKDSNKAAAKLLSANDAELYADVQAWLQFSAKDSDNPSGCQ
jgi:cytochrome c5